MTRAKRTAFVAKAKPVSSTLTSRLDLVFSNFPFILSFYACISVLLAWMYICAQCACLVTAVSHYVGTENRTRVLCKNSKCVQLLSHVSSPCIWYFLCIYRDTILRFNNRRQVPSDNFVEKLWGRLRKIRYHKILIFLKKNKQLCSLI